MRYLIANTLALFSALFALFASNYLIVSYNAANKAAMTLEPIAAMQISGALAMLKTLAMLGWIGYIYALVVFFILFVKLLGAIFDPRAKE